MDVPETAACLNCGRPLTGPYCADCGQKKRATDLTLRELLHETTSRARELGRQDPEHAQDAVLQAGCPHGRLSRRTACAVALAAAPVSPLQPRVLRQQADRRGDLAALSPRRREGRRHQSRRQPVADTRGARRASKTACRRVSSDATASCAPSPTTLSSTERSRPSLPKAMFILLPAFAGLTMLAWRRRLPRYPAHLYLALHLHSAWFGALAVLTMVEAFVTSEVVLGLIGFAMFVYTVAYALLAARRIFGESWVRTVAKASAVAVVYALCLAVVSSGAPGLRDYKDVTGDTQPGQSPGTFNVECPRPCPCSCVHAVSAVAGSPRSRLTSGPRFRPRLAGHPGTPQTDD